MLSSTPQSNRKWFIALAFMFQILMLLMYGFFSDQYNNDSGHQSKSQPERTYTYIANFQNMLFALFQLVGFGLLLVYFKFCTWTGLGFSLFITCMCVQMYPLQERFWRSIFIDGFLGQRVVLDPLSSTNGTFRCAVVMEIVLCTVVGRIGLLQLLLLGVGGTISYCFSMVVNMVANRARGAGAILNDIGGSMDVFMWAGIFALTLGYSVRMTDAKRNQRYKSIPENDSPMLAMLGTAFVWAGFMFMVTNDPAHQAQLDIAPMNMLLALSSSVLSIYFFSSWMHIRLGIYECVMGVISGGVVVGTVAPIAENPCIALCCGFWGGMVSYIFMHFLFARMNDRWMVMSHEVLGLFVINGFFGGIVSCIVLGAYVTNPPSRAIFTGSQVSTSVSSSDATYQLIHIAITIAMALATGFMSSGLLNCFVREQTDGFYDDFTYFNEDFALGDGGWIIDESGQLPHQQKYMPQIPIDNRNRY